MEKAKEVRRTRPSSADTVQDENVIIRHRRTEAGTPYVPIIRVIGEVSVRELLGRDDEETAPIADAET